MTTVDRAAQFIAQLRLPPHPEGAHFREVFQRSMPSGSSKNLMMTRAKRLSPGARSLQEPFNRTTVAGPTFTTPDVVRAEPVVMATGLQVDER